MVGMTEQRLDGSALQASKRMTPHGAQRRGGVTSGKLRNAERGTERQALARSRRLGESRSGFDGKGRPGVAAQGRAGSTWERGERSRPGKERHRRLGMSGRGMVGKGHDPPAWKR